MNHSKISLNALIKNIENNHYVTPVFKGRRDFVWDVIDIEKLGDSIIRGIPIASLVTMPQNKELPANHLISGEKLVFSSSKNYIVDGYQRVVSISDIFLKTDTTFLYYFDLLAILNEKFSINKLSGAEVNLGGFCKSFHHNEPEQFKPRFLLAADVTSNKFNRGIGDFLQQIKHSIIITNKEIDKYLDYLTNILTSVTHYNLPITEISSSEDIVSIKRIYEKLNLPLLYQQT